MMSGMPHAAGRDERISGGLWFAATATAVLGAALTAMAWSDMRPGDAYLNGASAVAAVVYASLGALIVRRVGNLIGWILESVGFAFAVLSTASAYAVLGIATHPGTLPVPQLVGAIAQWSFVVSAPALAFMLLFFPTGALPSGRWRPILILGIVATALTLIG